MSDLKIKVVLLIALLFGALLSAPHASYALVDISEDDIAVEIIPENPEPYQDATIILSSYATDIDKAMITWTSGSKALLAGYGKTRYSFKMLGPNTTTLFIATITTPEGVSITKRIALTSSDMDLLWQAVDAYVPPFYKGKAFPTKEGLIKAVAIPNNSTASNNSIVYTWKKDSNTLKNVSGYGKNSYLFQNNPSNSKENISVLASSVNGAYNANRSIVIPVTSPKIVFYKKSPIEGVFYQKALGEETDIGGNELSIKVEPYFLALKNKENDFTYSWNINGDEINTPRKKTELTIRPIEEEGYATIGITLENINALFQKAGAFLRVNL